MNTPFNLFLVGLITLASPLLAPPRPGADSSKLLMNNENKIELVVNNRVLTAVDNKPLTMLDVLKELDIRFYREYPQYIDSKQARAQYYAMHWKEQLSELINKELILTDAKEHKIEVSKGDIRQELEETFGPNVISNLDKAGLTVDEAWEMLRKDITIRRAIMAMVNSKAIRRANPNNLREAYIEYAKNNTKPEKWTYRVVSIRDEDPLKSAEAARLAYMLFEDGNIQIDNLTHALKVDLDLPESTTVSVSEEFEHTLGEMAPSYSEVILEMAPGTYSFPVTHKGRKDNKLVRRIFYLVKKDHGGAPSFQEVSKQLRQKIISDAIEEESQNYIAGLRKQYEINEEAVLASLPKDFKPIEIKQLR